VLANSGARPGDHLILTKALGTGVISTAIKKGKAEQGWVDAAVASMTTLNKAPAEVIVGVAGTQSTDGGIRRETGNWKLETGVHALTDITGFGLIGHAREMALASDVSLRLRASAVPILPGAIECVRAGFIPGGLTNNREFAECAAEFDPAIPGEIRALLFDPQTAGGLLISVAADAADGLLGALRGQNVPAALIGEALPRTQPLISVVS
jgi:selenide,water dikinase